MYPTLLDIETGETKECVTWDWDVFWWTDGNGACDCNRAHAMGKHDEMDARMRAQHPNLRAWQSNCYGCKRFLVVEVHGDLEGLTREEVIREANSEYKMR